MQVFFRPLLKSTKTLPQLYYFPTFLHCRTSTFCGVATAKGPGAPGPPEGPEGPAGGAAEGELGTTCAT